MKLVLDNFLKPALLGDATKEKPVIAVVKKVQLKTPADLRFETDEDKHELTLELNGEIKTWLANKTSLRAIMEVFGDETDKWIGKKISLWTIHQNVKGKLTRATYADAVIE